MSSKLRIVHAASYGGPSPGSFIPNICELARTAIARGHTFTLVTMHVPNATWHEMVRSTGARLVVTSGMREAYRAVAAERPDVVHTHFLGYTVPATLAVLHRPARVVWHIHTAMPPRPSPAARLRAGVRFSLFGRRADRFVAVSQALANELASWGVAARKTTVIPNAIDVAHFRPPAPEERAAARAEFGVSGDQPVFAFFGRDTFIKGTDVLIEALAGAPRLTMIAVGAPDDSLALLRERADVIAVPRIEDTRRVYWASDALVMASRMEAAPYTLMEAMSCGIPAIASDIPSMRETAREQPSVRFFPAGDATALRAALASLHAGEPQHVPDALRERLALQRWAGDVLSLYE